MAKIHDPLNMYWRSTHSGITGALSRSGPIARLQSHPAKSSHYSAYNVIGHQSLIQSAWRSLSPVSQSLWSQFGIDYPDYDKYGNPRSLLGFQVFCRYNVPLFYFFKLINTTPPPDNICSYLPNFGLYSSGPPYTVYTSIDTAIPSGCAISIKRKINTPIYLPFSSSHFSFYGHFFSSTSLLFPTILPFDLFLGKYQQNVACYSIDNYGRRSSESILFLVSDY
jgi:hypothetical protein